LAAEAAIARRFSLPGPGGFGSSPGARRLLAPAPRRGTLACLLGRRGLFGLGGCLGELLGRGLRWFHHRGRRWGGRRFGGRLHPRERGGLAWEPPSAPPRGQPTAARDWPWRR